MNTLDGTGQKNNFTQTYEAYVNDIYRLCFSFMKNHMDAEDIVHETFLKYYHLDRTFGTAQKSVVDRYGVKCVQGYVETLVES